MTAPLLRLSVFRALIVFVFTVVAILPSAASQQQATESVSTIGELLRAGLQQSNPPASAASEGVDLVLRVVDAATGEALPGARIDLSRSPTAGAPPVLNDKRPRAYTGMTDERGVVNFPNMMADRYTITPTLANYLAAGGTVNSIALTSGTKTSPVTLRMWKASILGGIVVDRDGNPVVDATVEILTEGWTGGLRTLALAQPSAATDRNGAYSFSSVLPGAYYLRATPSDETVRDQLQSPGPTAFVDTFYPNAMHLELTAPVAIYPGANLYGQRIEMQKSRYYSVSGRVTGLSNGPEGSGLILIRRVAADSPVPFIQAAPYAGAISVQLAPDGTFSAPNVPPGPYWAGYTPPGALRGGAQFLVVDRNIENLQFEVKASAAFTGRAVYEDGSPVESGWIATMKVFDPALGDYVRNLVVGTNGEFSVTGLPVGAYRVEFTGSIVVRKIDINSRTHPGGEFELTSDSGRAVLTLSHSGGGIQGTVDLLDRARSYPRGIVTIVRLPIRPIDTVIRRYVDGTAAFAVDYLEAGRYRVCAWLEEGADVDRVLENPRYEQKLGSACEAVDISVQDRKQVRLKQISAQEIMN